MDELEAIPGIGKSTAGDVVVNRPYESVSEFDADLDQFVTVQTPEGAD
jgi:DNA uptake protein ComE-like DNA-binding protein